MSARPQQIFATVLNQDSYFLIWIPKEPHEKKERKVRSPESNSNQDELTIGSCYSLDRGCPSRIGVRGSEFDESRTPLRPYSLGIEGGRIRKQSAMTAEKQSEVASVESRLVRVKNMENKQYGTEIRRFIT